jgi:hypothetical protein
VLLLAGVRTLHSSPRLQGSQKYNSVRLCKLSLLSATQESGIGTGDPQRGSKTSTSLLQEHQAFAWIQQVNKQITVQTLQRIISPSILGPTKSPPITLYLLPKEPPPLPHAPSHINLIQKHFSVQPYTAVDTPRQQYSNLGAPSYRVEDASAAAALMHALCC